MYTSYSSFVLQVVGIIWAIHTCQTLASSPGLSSGGRRLVPRLLVNGCLGYEASHSYIHNYVCRDNMVDQVSPKIHPAAVVECEITRSIVLQTVHMAVPERYYTTGSFGPTTQRSSCRAEHMHYRARMCFIKPHMLCLLASQW